jgi:cytochrome c-type biogenesis protein CcmH
VKRAAALALASLFLMAAAPGDPAERLPNPAQEAHARTLFKDIRCLVCQNESIDDSDAELAGDLRRLVREQVKAGRSDDQIKRFLTDRYGEFVLMQPSFSPANLFLWGAPFLVVLGGVGLLLARLRKRDAEPELSPEEVDRLGRLAPEKPET